MNKMKCLPLLLMLMASVVCAEDFWADAEPASPPARIAPKPVQKPKKAVKPTCPVAVAAKPIAPPPPEPAPVAEIEDWALMSNVGNVTGTGQTLEHFTTELFCYQALGRASNAAIATESTKWTFWKRKNIQFMCVRTK